jgi:RNA-binding protein
MAIQLTPSQKKQLRALGQPLAPTLQIGREGMTDAVSSALEPLLKRHELVKARVLQSSPVTPQAAGEALAMAADASLVGVVGRTILLYRPNPERKDRIRLVG